MTKVPMIAKQFFLVGLCFSVSTAAVAGPYTVDVYRSTQLTDSEVNTVCKKELAMMSDLYQQQDVFSNAKKYEQFTSAGSVCKAKLLSKAKFAYFHPNIVKYQDDPVLHLMFDVVDEKDKARLQGFLPVPTKTLPDPGGLIAAWLAYERVIEDMINHRKFPRQSNPCPALHCAFGFEEPQLKPYEKIFSQGVPQHKEELITILREDKDPEWRAAAAFLLAHTADPQVLANILIPSLKDSSSHVRNNVMRVMIFILKDHNIDHFPISEIAPALDYPDETDRNKSLFVVLGLAQHPEYVPYIKQHLLRVILWNFKLSQPNLHNPAYQILLKISGKNFGERDYAAWSQWADEQ